MGVRDESQLEATGGELLQHRRHVVIEEEVLAGRPLVVNLAGAIVEAVSAPTHRFDHAARIADEDIGLVYVILRRVEHRGGRSYGRIETRAVDPDAVPGAEALVTFALKGRPRIDQREVDVEED